ncbi:hypothetical protein DPMN_134913 [Dreissena polymorpha]|uniref:Uncharacterized protein n=1 Tax=Dreissena polymorpha TaxID=45954 RepID=A0A9D4FX18_DREPO|nr:hypothetical protein DPMN_134913 [Dreissena polymorpha]
MSQIWQIGLEVVSQLAKFVQLILGDRVSLSDVDWQKNPNDLSYLSDSAAFFYVGCQLLQGWLLLAIILQLWKETNFRF